MSFVTSDRLALALVLIGLPLLCWAWVIAMSVDMYGPMTGASAWMMSMSWDARRILLLWAMWAAMMAGMMLPSATPMILLYARTATAKQHAGSVVALAGGYLVIWALFSVGATLLQRVLATRVLLTPMMEPALPGVAGGVLMLAGLYQFTPWKHACLTVCRSPLSVLMQRWRSGTFGAFRMGAEQGLYCLGCCWALMLVLFAGGVMNLWVILALTAWVAVEKLAPFGQRTAPAAGALLLAIGAALLVQSNS
ncbi:MAG: DUF2182 domain-containing protein [Vicinamibacterales bacterium]